MDIGNPIITREKNPEKRKGRLHSVDKETLFGKENAKKILEVIWTWRSKEKGVVLRSQLFHMNPGLKGGENL